VRLGKVRNLGNTTCECAEDVVYFRTACRYDLHGAWLDFVKIALRYLRDANCGASYGFMAAPIRNGRIGVDQFVADAA
jgi:hypothetical protein